MVLAERSFHCPALAKPPKDRVPVLGQSRAAPLSISYAVTHPQPTGPALALTELTKAEF